MRRKRKVRATRERKMAEEIREKLAAETDPEKRKQLFRELDTINIRIVRLEIPRSGHFGGR